MTRTTLGRRLALAITLVLSGSGSTRSQIPDQFPLTLNEIDAAGGVQFVEVHNRGAEVVSLEEYSLTLVSIDGDRNTTRQLPEFQLAPGDFFAVFLLKGEGDECRAVPGTNTVCLQFLDRNLCPIDMDKAGGRVSLRWSQSTESTEVESVRYARTPMRSMSYGKQPGGEWCILFNPTPGSANDNSCIPPAPVVLNEISSAEGFPCSFDCSDWVEILWLRGPERDLREFALIDRDGENQFLFDNPVVNGLPNPLLNAENPRIIVLMGSDGDPGRPELFFAPFGLKAEGDSLTLHLRKGMGRDPVESYDSVTIPRNPLAVPRNDDRWDYLARVPDGIGAWRINDAASPGGVNQAAGAQGVKPEVWLEDRFPLRVFPRERGDPAGRDHEPIQIFARASDRDDDLATVALIVEGKGHPAEGTMIYMEPGRAVTCEGDDLDRERGVFVGRIDRPFEGEIEWVVRVKAWDRSGQVAESGRHRVYIQSRGWDPGDRTHLLRINEVAADDPALAGADWLELYNPTEHIIRVGGLYLTNDILEVVNENRRLPDEFLLGPHKFRRIWCDDGNGDLADRNPHLPFTLDACRDEIILVHSDQRHVLDVISFHKEKSGISLGRFPDGAGADEGALTLMIPSPEKPNIPANIISCVDIAPPGDEPRVMINEIMADNWESGADARGERGDWLELYNPTDETVWLDGWTLWDRSIGNGFQPPWSFPAGSRIAPNCFLRIWCDDDEECENRGEPGTVFCEDPSGELHTNFAINRLFDYVALVDPCNHFVDCVTVGFQARDVSAGRSPIDGTAAFLVPTPGAPNVLANFPRRACAETAIKLLAEAPPLNEINLLELLVCRGRRPPPQCVLERFKRGDANSDCEINLADAVFLLKNLFGGGPATCEDAADANDDGTLNISDAVFVLNYLFSGGRKPKLPGPDVPGLDPTDDPLNCESSGCN